MKGDWFYTTKNGVFGEGRKATKRSPPGKFTWWINDGFTRKGTWKISRSVRAYVYLVHTCQVMVRPGLVGNSAFAADVQ